MRQSVLLTLLMVAVALAVAPRGGSTEAHTGDLFSVHWHAAARGNDFDGDGDLDWCDSRGGNGWHGWDDAIDEQERSGVSSCASGAGFWVDLAALGYMSTGRQVWGDTALWVKVYDGQFSDGCNYTYLYAVGEDSWGRGIERLLHTQSDYSGQIVWISVLAQKNGWYQNWWKIGSVVNDDDCWPCLDPPQCTQRYHGWTGYHIHQGRLVNCTGYARGTVGHYNEKWVAMVHDTWWWEGQC